MKRAILLSRVSTQGQDLLQQNESLYSYAKSFGYSEDECILIDFKESAIRLAEEERIGLTRLKETIETIPTIEVVFAYEISRIGRRAEVNYSIRRFLQDRHIQLRIQDLNIKCFNEKDWTIDVQGNVLFSIFNALAENEMLDKKARMQRGKEHARQAKKYVGGRLVYGYMVDVKKNIVINTDEACIVKRIFDMYINGQSTPVISRQLREEGVLKHKTLDAAMTFVSLVLRNEAYKGSSTLSNYEHTSKKDVVKYGYTYPALITEDEWNAAIAMRKRNSTKTNERATTNIYLAKGLVYWGDHKLSVCRRNNAYQYKERDTDTRFMVNMSMIESLAWYHSKRVCETKSIIDKDEMIANMKAKRDEYIARNRNLLINSSKLREGLERIQLLYVDGKIDYDRMSTMQSDKEREIKDIELTAEKYLRMAQNIIVQLEDLYRDNTRDYNLVTDIAERAEICQKTIGRISVSKGGDTQYIYNVDIDGVQYVIDSHPKHRWIYCNGLRVSFEYIPTK